MPVCSLYLLALNVAISEFVAALVEEDVRPIILAKALRWVIKPDRVSLDLLDTQWDIVLVLPPPSSSTNPALDPLPERLSKLVKARWSLAVGIPSRLLADFPSKNRKLLHAMSAPPVVSSALSTIDYMTLPESSQNLELSPDLRTWAADYFSTAPTGKGPVSMLNLLAFKPGMKDSYISYGKAFSESAGARHGGNAKIVGSIVRNTTQAGTGASTGTDATEWDEVALAHYPSIAHFVDMLVSEEYQAANQKYRLPALKDTCILCTTELGLADGPAAKL